MRSLSSIAPGGQREKTQGHRYEGKRKLTFGGWRIYIYTVLAHFPLTHGHLRPPIAASKNIFSSVSYFGNKLACRNRYVRSSCRLLVNKYSAFLQQLYVDQLCRTEGLTEKSTSTV
jgi:hypothetical protein